MNKLLVICGPTATGKTQLALELAKKFDGILISADSRQVYKYMDIGTGKDVKNILGYDLVDPNEEFSISHYSAYGRKKIKEIQDRKRLPILVGGSGLYIKSVTDSIDTINIPFNKTLRNNLKDKNVEELVKILKLTDNKRFLSMNNSDRNNPRRLIRAIEIASDSEVEIKKKAHYDVLFIGLTASYEELKTRIEERVGKRIQMGFEKEINFLKEKNYWSGAPLKTLGYKDWPDIEQWKNEEFKYAKRQITWFKKDKRIKWFDVTKRDYQKEVEKLTNRWYSDSNAKN